MNNLRMGYRNGLFFIFLGQLIINPSEITRDSVITLFPGLDPEDVPGYQLLNFIGLGSGITPPGDDFQSGDFLARYFIEKGRTPIERFVDTGERILAEADKKNTALSTALINCALEGAADERIMDSLSFIAEGQGDIQEISNGIASYGNASGIDALTGMLAAILNQYFIGRKPK